MSKQMKLKELVPPLELCKKIPVGEFEQSALVFACQINDDDEEETDIFTRDMIEHLENKIGGLPYIIYPAPTLQEIMAELPTGDTGCFCYYQGNGVWSMGDCECDLYVKNGTEDSNPAAAALKVWLEMKGIK